VERVSADHFQRGNLHTHSRRSDGAAPLEAMVDWYRSHGYQFLAMTEHDLRVDPGELGDLTGPGFVVIPGEEVTDRWDHRPLHVNALCARERIDGGRDFDRADDGLRAMLAQIRAAGGMPLVNHPNFHGSLTADDIAGGASGRYLLEIWSGHPDVAPRATSRTHPPRPSGTTCSRRAATRSLPPWTTHTHFRTIRRPAARSRARMGGDVRRRDDVGRDLLGARGRAALRVERPGADADRRARRHLHGHNDRSARERRVHRRRGVVLAEVRAADVPAQGDARSITYRLTGDEGLVRARMSDPEGGTPGRRRTGPAAHDHARAARDDRGFARPRSSRRRSRIPPGRRGHAAPLSGVLAPAAHDRPLLGGPGGGLSLFYGAHVINDPHFAVTYLLFYERARARAFGGDFEPLQRVRYLLAGLMVPVALVGWAGTALATRSAYSLGLLIQTMFFLVGWHYVKQGFGVMTVLAARRGVRFSPHERLAILAHCYAGWAYAWASPYDPGKEVEEKGVVYTTIAHPHGLERVTLVVFLASAVWLFGVLVQKWRRERRLPILTPLVALLSSVWIWSIYSSIDPLVVYAIPALHSVQYLYFVWLLKGNEARERRAPMVRARRPRANRAPRGLGDRPGVAAVPRSPRGPRRLPGPPALSLHGAGPTPYFAALFAIVNIHHYFMDYVIWRRDNRQTRYLLERNVGRSP